MGKELKRSLYDKKLAGVCGGIAHYFGWSSTNVRILWVVMMLFAGTGLFLYIALALIMPESMDY